MNIKLKKRTKIFSIILICVLVCTFFTNHTQAEASGRKIERESIKAGFFAWDGYHVQDDNGIRSGYGYDFLKMTENYCNWKIDFVGYDKTWSDMLTMLDNGEIDILTSAQKIPEWEEKYDFSDQPIGNSATILSVRKEDTKYVVGDTKTYDGMTIGCLKGSSRNEKFANFAKENNFTYQYKYYENLEELKKALFDKKVDSILSTNLRTVVGETVLEEFDPVDYYAITKKGNGKIMEQINHAISKMNFNTPSWKEELQKKYFSESDEEELIFSKEELDYLEELKEQDKVFTVVTNPDLAPYSSYDKSGNPVGIAPDLFRELAKRIGLKYEFVKFSNYEEYNQYVRMGKADIDLTCFHDYGLAADHGIDVTNPYMTTSLAILSRNNFSGNINRIAVVNGSNHNTTYAGRLFEGYESVPCETNRECIKAVKNREVDVAYLYTYTAQKAVEDDTKNRLMYTILPQYEVEICIGVNDNIDYHLISVINEGIRALSGTYTENLIQEEITHMSDKNDIVSLVYDYPGYALVLAGIFVVIFCIVIYVIIRRKQTERLLIKESEINNARTEFFMLISHELRTPLNAVVSYLRMIRDENEKNAYEQEYVKKAELAAMQLTEISDSMLDYSKISSGSVELKDEIVKIKDTILQVDEIISLKAKEKRQDYSFNVKNISRQYFRGDSLRIALIYQNILENAVKFTKAEGSVKAELSEEIIDEENVNLIFTCEDNGKGMSQEFTRKIDMAFHQSDPSYSRTHGGLGLGLFLTQFFVKMMNGTFEVKSKEGEGSSFKIVIPLKCPSIEELTENNIKCKKIKTIVYEQNEENMTIAKDTLKKIGVKADFITDEEKLRKRILSRVGGQYEYEVCIINVDYLEDYKTTMNNIHKIEPSLEIFALSFNQKLCESLSEDSDVSHAIYIPYSYFELFNAFITDFGEYKPADKKYSNVDYTGVRAMIVEDNMVNADILRRILMKAKIEADIFENGKLAVDAFDKSEVNKYQIIFMDIQMPVMNGYEATKIIRNSFGTRGKEIPIIAVSANAFPEDVKKSINTGMNAHIAKPVDQNTLFAEIERLGIF